MSRQEISLESADDEVSISAPHGGTFEVRVGEDTIVCTVVAAGGLNEPGARSGGPEVRLRVIAPGGAN